MLLLRSVAKLSKNKEDLTIIYKLFIQSMLELNSSVWHPSLSLKNKEDLEKLH